MIQEQIFDAKLKAMLERDEGRKPFYYKDTKGLLTIGVGRCLDATPLSPDEIDYLYGNDLRRAKAVVGKFFDTSSLGEKRLAVLVNMAFNLGEKGLKKFVKMRHAIESGDFELAAREMINSKWYVQTGERAKRLVKMMREGGDL